MPQCSVAQIWLGKTHKGKMRQKRFVREPACENKKGNDGNLFVDRRASVIMPAPPAPAGLTGAPASQRRETGIANGAAEPCVGLGGASRLHLCAFEWSRAAFEDVCAQPVRKFSLRLQMSPLDGKSIVLIAQFVFGGR